VNETKILLLLSVAAYLGSFLFLGLNVFLFSLVFHGSLFSLIHFSNKLARSDAISSIVSQAQEILNEQSAVAGSDNVVSLSTDPKDAH
jgi:hypothetical protein